MILEEMESKCSQLQATAMMEIKLMAMDAALLVQSKQDGLVSQEIVLIQLLVLKFVEMVSSLVLMLMLVMMEISSMAMDVTQPVTKKLDGHAQEVLQAHLQFAHLIEEMETIMEQM